MYIPLSHHDMQQLMRVCTGKLYGDVEHVDERHRHRYEVNVKYLSELEKQGFTFVGRDVEGKRMEIFELKG